MDLTFSELNWWSVLASVFVGQLISTIWFVVLFGQPWAHEYGVTSKKQHTSEIPGYTYAIQLLCTIAMVLSLAVLYRWLAVDSLANGLQVGGLVALGFCLATGLPGQAFLKRWRVAAIALGCQISMILGVSVILSLWR